MRLDEIPSVDDRTGGSDKLNRRNGYRLPESHARQIARHDVIFVDEHGVCLPHEIDSGLPGEPESLEIGIEGIRSHRKREIDENGVAAVVERL